MIQLSKETSHGLQTRFIHSPTSSILVRSPGPKYSEKPHMQFLSVIHSKSAERAVIRIVQLQFPHLLQMAPADQRLGPLQTSIYSPNTLVPNETRTYLHRQRLFDMYTPKNGLKLLTPRQGTPLATTENASISHPLLSPQVDTHTHVGLYLGV